jgi:hypothetical protein
LNSFFLFFFFEHGMELSSLESKEESESEEESTCTTAALGLEDFFFLLNFSSES